MWRIPGIPALTTVTLLAFSGYAALLSVGPLWAVHGGAGTAGAGTVNGVLLLFTVLTQPLVPTGLRRLGWRPVLMIGMVLLGLPPLAYTASDALWVTLAISAVRGIGFAILTVTGSAAVAELVEPARRGAAIGVYGLAIAVPQLVLLPGAPWLAEHVSFGLVFMISSLPLLGIIAAPALARAIENSTGSPSPDPSAMSATADGQLRRLLRPVVLLLGVTLVGGAVLTFLPQMSDSTLTAVGLFLLTLTAALARWRAGPLADRHGAQRFLGPLVALTAASVSAVAWSVRDTGSTQAAPLLAGLAVLGVCYGGLQNLTLVTLFRSVTRDFYSRASAVWNLGFDLGTGLGSVLIGFLAAGTSFAVALLAAAALSLATLPLALFRPHRPGSGAAPPVP